MISKTPLSHTQDSAAVDRNPAKNMPATQQRRHFAGDLFHALQNRRQDAGATQDQTGAQSMQVFRE
jgi:hypothetical protein